jgi:hypothetical protein
MLSVEQQKPGQHGVIPIFITAITKGSRVKIAVAGVAEGAY